MELDRIGDVATPPNLLLMLEEMEANGFDDETKERVPVPLYDAFGFIHHVLAERGADYPAMLRWYMKQAYFYAENAGWDGVVEDDVPDDFDSPDFDRFCSAQVYPKRDKVFIDSVVELLGPSKRIGPEIRRLVFERDAYRCVDCDGWHNLTVDHVIPQSKGGSHAMGNLVTRCQSCNSKKGTAL